MEELNAALLSCSLRNASFVAYVHYQSPLITHVMLRGLRDLRAYRSTWHQVIIITEALERF